MMNCLIWVLEAAYATLFTGCVNSVEHSGVYCIYYVFACGLCLFAVEFALVLAVLRVEFW